MPVGQHHDGRGISRRSLLVAGGLGGALATAPPWMASSARASMTGLPSANHLWAWNEKLATFGTRLTGTTAHRHYVDWLADQLGRTGLKVHRDRLTFDKWEPRRWSLTVEGKPVPVAFYFPYSGETPPAGITAPMIHLGLSPLNAALWSLARGKIAVVEVASPPLPINVAFPETGRHSPSMASPSLLVSQPSISDIALAPLLAMAKQSGVAGVICIRTGVSDDMAKDQYAPFTTGYMGTPALWLGPTAGKTVRAKALAGATATLQLDATITRNAATETLWAVLPGSDAKEAVVVNTHTDGPNVAEENGGLGLLALAQQYSRIPRSKRRRTLIFVATTGHFQLPQFAIGSGQSASRWIADHPEYLDGGRHKTVAALTLEHLGCMEWEDKPLQNTYRASGRKDVAYCFTTTPTMRREYLASAAGTTNDRTITAQPAIYVGEGHDFHDKKIATASLIPSMTYLVAAPKDGALKKLDKHYMHGQISTFSKLIKRLDSLDAAKIGTPLL